MSTFINTNSTASMAALNLNNNNNALSGDIEELSTGLRINSAADDAAGFVVSENMSAQLSGLNQATSNTNDAVNMTKTAEGALTQVQNLLISMRQLAVQASNLGVNDSTDVQADQTQIASAIQSINEIAQNTQFGTKFLLDGSSTAATTTSASTAAYNGSDTNFSVIQQGAFSATGSVAGTLAAGTLNNISATAATATTMNSTAVIPAAGQAAYASTDLFEGSVTINGTQYNVGAAGNNQTLAQLNGTIASSGYVATINATTGQLTLTNSTTGTPASAQTVDFSSLNTFANATTTTIKGAYGAAGTNNSNVVITNGAAAIAQQEATVTSGNFAATSRSEATVTSAALASGTYTAGDLFTGNLVVGGHTLVLSGADANAIQSAIQGIGTSGGVDYSGMNVTIAGNGAMTVTDTNNQNVTAAQLAINVSALTKDNTGGGTAGNYTGTLTVQGTAGTSSTGTYSAGDQFSGNLVIGGHSLALTNANAAAIQSAVQGIGTAGGVNYGGMDVTISAGGAITVTDTNNQNAPASALTINVSGLTKNNAGGGVEGIYTGVANVTGTAGIASVAATADSIVGNHNGAYAAGDTFGGSFKIDGHVVSLTGTTNTLAQLNTALQSTTGLATYTATLDSQGNITFGDSATGATTDTTDLSTLQSYGVGSNIATGGYTQVLAGTNATASFTDSTGSTVVNSSSSVTNGSQSTFYFANGLAFSINNMPTSGPVSVNGSIAATAGTTSVGQNLEFQIGANEGQTVELAIGSTGANSLGSGATSYTDAQGNTQQVLTNNVSDINVTTFKGAQDAIAVLDKAISQVSSIEANLGAFQSNVLQSQVQSLGTATTNLQAAQATIQDANMASTIVDYTKNQILVQSATSALAYANQMPQSILKLLQ